MTKNKGWLVVGVSLALALVVWVATYLPLRGTVIDAESRGPVAGAHVRLPWHGMASDSEGRFLLRGLRGRPHVQAEAPGYKPAAGTMPLAAVLGLGQPFMLALQPVELGGRVLDAATGRPVVGARVTIGAQVLEADADGSYIAKRVLPGQVLRAEAPYYAPGEQLVYSGEAERDLTLTRLPVALTVSDGCLRHPISGARVCGAGVEAMADEQGRLLLAHIEPASVLAVTAVDYDSTSIVASPGDRMTVTLTPTELCGRVLGVAGEPLAGALVLARARDGDTRLMYTDDAGEYRLQGVPEGATLIVRKGGYRRAERTLGAERCLEWQLEPSAAQAIYLGFHLLTADYASQLRANIALVERSPELNAVVIEVKTGGGYLAFAPQLPLARQLGADAFETINLKALLAELRAKDIYTIARMPIFADNLLGTLRPAWAVHRPDGSVWRDALDGAWTDPFRREVWEYNVALAREAIELGFDEVQFDYVRFPSDGAVGQCRYMRESTPESRVEAITGFVAYARRELDPTGAYLSADLFGLTTFDPEEKGIGQLMERLGPHLDYVSPMVYPSTYLRGMLDIADPWRSPYEVVKRSLDAAHRKTSTPIRPWLQHFDDYHGLGICYGLPELLAQKRAAADGGACGWMFWNIMGEYDPRAFGLE
ncbi:MAG: putative glycoside hydrolase [Anaerolineae bacterium]